MTSRTLVVLLVSLVISACGGSSGGGSTSPPPPGNVAPVADAGLDQSGISQGATVTLDGSGSSDADGDPLTYAWTLATVPAGSAAALSDATAVGPTFDADLVGSYVAELVVNDGTVDSAPDTVTIVVEAAPPGNTAPIADAGPDQSGIFAGGTVALDGSGSSDADGDPLTYAWTLTAVPAGSAATLSDATAAAPTFTADVVGSYVAELVVNDGTVDSAPDTVTIAVEAPPPDNSAPIADAGPDQPGVPQNATVTLDGSASSDPDGDSLTYAWTLTSVPTGSAAALSDATAVRPTFIADSAGTYVAELVVNDGAADSAPDTVTITVDSGAPTADAGPDQADVSQGATVTLDGSASSDPDGDPLTYAWTLITVPDGSTAVLSDATVVGPTFVADLAGSYVAELVVSDGTFDSAPDRVTITVDSEAPTADAGPDQSGVSQGATVALDGSGSSDPTGDPLTYAWTLTSIPVGSAAVLSDATAVGPTFVVDLAGSYVAELVVNDGTFDSEPDTVTVTVDDTAPFAPAGLTASGEDGEVILNWDDNAELDLAAAPYNVRRSETQGGPYTDVSGPLSASTFTDATVVNETTYYYVVTAEDAASNVSPDSAEVAAMPNGPVHAYWEMDEGAGATTADTEVLGGTSDGTLADPTTWTTGVAGNGIDFNGTSDFVEIANTPELQITGTEITLMAWIYPREGFDSPGPGLPAGSRVISKRTDAGGNEVYALKLEDYRLCFRLNETFCQYSNHILVLNEWVHVAMVYNGVDKRIYVNGVLDDSGPEPRTDPIRNSSRAVHLGVREDEGRFFNGVLDEVQILNRALSAAEVQAIAGAITPPLPGPGLRFTNITETAGTGGPRVGARGIMFAEVNNDSLPDFYMTRIADGFSRYGFYFENIDGVTFDEVAVERNIADTDGGSYGAVWADLDNDGDYDFFYGSTNDENGLPENNNVYENDGSANFIDVTPAAILSTETQTRGVTAFDMDNDGDLDLYGVSGGLTPGVNEAYLNGLIGGTGVEFDFTSYADVALTTADVKNGVTDTDYDNDGDIDIIAADTTGEFVILENDGTGTFAEVVPSTLGIIHPAGTGITPADIDNDGDLDLLLTSQNLQSYLYRREPDGSVPLYVLQQTFVNGWMGSFADLDNDGDLDLIFSGDFRSYINDGSGTFTSGQSVPVPDIIDARAIAFADINSDGDLDFAVGGKGDIDDPDGRSVLIRNDIDADAGNWLRVELVSPTCQAGAFGARTRIYAAGDAGGTLLAMRESRGNHGYHAQNEPVLHFGLGSVVSVDVVVDWVDGTQTQVLAQAANQRILVDECP